MVIENEHVEAHGWGCARFDGFGVKSSVAKILIPTLILYVLVRQKDSGMIFRKPRSWRVDTSVVVFLIITSIAALFVNLTFSNPTKQQ
jgi:hypothetical protein